MDLKLVLSTKDGKTYQKDLPSNEAEFFHNKKIGDNIDGNQIGLAGYQLEITGGSDKCGFPMRKGVQQDRKKLMAGAGVGFSEKDRNGNKQVGLLRRRTICGERINTEIRQVNMKVLKEGEAPLVHTPGKAKK